MKKSKKDEQMREFILELQKESKEDFERARADLKTAEANLVGVLDETQQALFKEYCVKKKAFDMKYTLFYMSQVD